MNNYRSFDKTVFQRPDKQFGTGHFEHGRWCSYVEHFEPFYEKEIEGKVYSLVNYGYD